MTSTLSRPAERLWYGTSGLALLLQPFALLFGLVVRLRRALYRAGWLHSRHPGIPVIVVGNLTVGGTGKTPIVAWLAERLRVAGMRPAIVSRGYGGVLSRGLVRVSAQSSAADVGDEPLLLARRGAVVVIGADRAAAAALAREQGADVIVADDGLQHYALARDLEIIVLDGERQLGNGRLLPAGPLREPASRLAEAALVLVNGAAFSRAGQIGFDLRLTEARALDGEIRRPLDAFAGRKVWAVAGIGHPRRFVAALERLGLQPVAVDVPDHGVADLRRLRANGDWPILMTEKDAVKYPQCPVSDAWYVPAEVVIAAHAEAALMRCVQHVLHRERAHD